MDRTRYLTQAGLIAAVYAALTTLTVQTMGFLAWGPVQFRVSEAFTVIAMFTPAAVPGLFIGSLVANLTTFVQTGSPLALLDVAFGSLGSLMGAWWMWRARERRWLAMLGPVVANALIVPAYLPWLIGGLGLYQLPLLGIDLEGNWLGMYLFGVAFVGFGQAVVVYGLGAPLAAALRRMDVGTAMERHT